MAFPTPNTVCDWWDPGVPLDVFNVTDASVCQQLKPLIPFNEFQSTRYPQLIYRFALTPTTNIVGERMVGGAIGIPNGEEWVSVYRVLGSQTVNRSPAITHYHYLVCKLIGWLDEFGVIHNAPA